MRCVRPFCVPLLAIGLCACASLEQRPLVGRGKVVALVPLVATQLITEVPITIEDGRVIGSSDFDVAVSGDSCLRANVNHRDVNLCAGAPAGGKQPALDRRWRSMNSLANLGTVNYGVEVAPGGEVLRWESGLSEVRVLLGDDPLADAVRAAPELLGAMIAFGQVPAAKDYLLRLVPDTGFDKPEPGKVRAELVLTYKQYGDAVARRDFEALRGFFTKDVIWNLASGEALLRPQVEERMKAFLGALEPGARMVTRVRSVEVTGASTATAEVEVETAAKVREAGGVREVNYTVVWKDTWRKVEGRWRNQAATEL
jgi:ketosteroid isomerase-like protein